MRIFGFSSATAVNSVVSPVGSSPIEKAFLRVPALQDVLSVRDMRTLAPVSSTLNAIASGDYVWRKHLARDLRVDSSSLGYPIDTEAEEAEDYSVTPYRQIYRGWRICDGETAPTVPPQFRDPEQQICVRRATRFLELNFPGLQEATLQRHETYAQHREEVTTRAVTLGSNALVTVLPVIGGSGLIYLAPHIGTMFRISAGNSDIIARLIGILGLETSTRVFYGLIGYSLYAGAQMSMEMGRMTSNEYIALQAAWQTYEPRVEETRINSHLASSRAQARVDKQRQENPRAGLNEVRHAHLAQVAALSTQNAAEAARQASEKKERVEAIKALAQAMGLQLESVLGTNNG